MNIVLVNVWCVHASAVSIHTHIRERERERQQMKIEKNGDRQTRDVQGVTAAVVDTQYEDK